MTNEKAKAAKQQRLAEALRANLKRRREAARRPGDDCHPGREDPGEGEPAGGRRRD